ncbi:hypothetical protein [Suttonella ornithocola]|uniref:Uncharacterized protein n=1 Tax=Suttonella ornithocola TaxID=279832 RepID=A0A380MSD3_9GAMM|nr:hypothetical protein [Suttonella ornithocola]SUO95212.1 Uncharacterised protein [Suttonella ornithocola]
MMTQSQHAQVRAEITAHIKQNGKHPTQCQTLLLMLKTGAEITQKDAEQYGLGAAFRSRISDLKRRGVLINSDYINVKSRFDDKQAQVKAHRLVGVAQ